jgi:hypothetical protein
MPKRKSTKKNSSPSPEEAALNKPAILRVVKQKDTATDDNNPAQTESASTAVSEQNQPVEPELQINNSQSQSIEVPESNSSHVLISDAVPQIIEAENEQLDLRQTVETAAGNLSESAAFVESKSDKDGQSEIDLDQAQCRKKTAYKKLETATNNEGQTFSIKEKIEVSTCNFGVQKVFIVSLYEAPDGSVWAYYHPIDTNQRQLWKRGCCRIENLRKLEENSCPA